MAKDKKPSIFADRGTIGSSDELDEYGVWVKSEPQDYSQVYPEADKFSTETPDTANLDAVIPDLEDLPDFDALGTSQNNDVSLNIPEDDFELPDFETEDKTTEEDTDSDVFNFGELTEPVDLNIPDLDSEEQDSKDDESFKEISMDEFVEPQNSPNPADSADSLESEESEKSEVSLESKEPSESPDLIKSEDPLESIDPLESAEPIEFEADIESVIIEAPLPAAEPVGIVQKAQDPLPAISVEKGTVKETQTLDLSTQLLMKIAEELSSIRSELSTLKKEFSGLRAAPPQAESSEKTYPEEDDEKISLTGDEMNNIINTADFTEEAGSDAAIGLSDTEDNPDELNLSTADLDVEIDLSDSNLENLEGETKLGNSSFDDNIDEDNKISSEIEIPDDSILEFSSDENDELNEILENGVEPMASAPAPEDANYLTEDPLAGNIDSEDFLPDLSEAAADEPIDFSEAIDEPIDLSGTVSESIDLSEAVIDEPDLSSEIQDNPLEEPSLEDISINLDLSDLDSVELDSSDLDSVELDSIEIEGDDYSKLPAKEENLEEITEEKPEEADETIDEIIEEIPEDVIEEIEEFLPDDESAEVIPETVIPAETVQAKGTSPSGEISGIPENLKTELKTVLSYMDQLLEALPDEKIEEFAKSDYYDTYKKLFKELGLV